MQASAAGSDALNKHSAVAAAIAAADRAREAAARLADLPQPPSPLLHAQLAELRTLAAKAELSDEGAAIRPESANVLRRATGTRAGQQAAARSDHGQQEHLLSGSAVVPTEVVVARNQFLVGENARLRSLLQATTNKMVDVLEATDGR